MTNKSRLDYLLIYSTQLMVNAVHYKIHTKLSTRFDFDKESNIFKIITTVFELFANIFSDIKYGTRK